MKLKSLLFMVTLFLVCLGVRADNDVVFEQHFESEQTAASTDVGFYEYINSMTGDTRTVEDGALKIFNDPATLCKTERWQRAVKFRNLPLKEGNTYRLSFKLKGSKTYNDGETDVNCKLSSLLMQGEDNADISLFDFDGKEQRLEAEGFNPDEFVSYTKTIVFASEEKQKEEYAKQDKGELADKFFLTLSIYNPGTFFLKDVVLSKVGAVQSAEFGAMGAIKVDFGKNTNIAAMAAAAPKGLVIFGDNDLQYASAKVNGEDAEIEAIEYHSDGCLYIFLVDPVDDEDNVVINFTNPTDGKQIKYIGKETESSVFDIVDYEATYNSALDDVLSFLYLSPELVSSYPANKAFAIDASLSEFTVTFDHEVVTSKINAVLNRGGEEVPLVLKEGTPATAETVVFVRNDNGLLAKNNRITLSNILTEYIEYPVEFTINFEAGKPKVAKEIITPVQTIDFKAAANNTIPLGWTLYNEYTEEKPKGEERPSGSTHGGGPRVLFPEGFYVRCDHGNPTMTFYGDLEGYAVTLPVGNLHIDFIASGYKTSGQKVLCEVLDATGANVLASKEVNLETVTPNGGPVKEENMQKITVEYNNAEEQNAILRYIVSGSGMVETILTSVVVNTYEKTEGDVPDDQIIFADSSFGNTADNEAPKTETGWELWQDNVIRPSGQNYSGNGTRIWKNISLKGLNTGYYCNGNWPATFMQYGAGASGAPTLALPAGEIEFTIYAANWKENVSRDIYFQVLDATGENVLVDNTFNTSAKNMYDNGQRGANYEADKFTFSWNCPKEGNYIIKFGSPAGETVMGNVSVIKPGSRAVKYYVLLAQTVDKAKAALVQVEDPIYDGETKTALAAGIAKYEDPDKITMTTEEEFNAAIAELKDLTKAMLTRFEYIPRFKKAYTDAETAHTSGMTTKFEKLECFTALEDVLATYKDVDPSTLEDEFLISATTSIENSATLFNNMKNTCVGLLTNQIVGLAKQLVELDETQAGGEYVLAAYDALTDDQEIAYQLKLRITKAIYDLCAQGNPFEEEELIDDEPSGIVTPVEIDVTNFIQNANFYSTGGVTATADDFPGWTMEKTQGNYAATWGKDGWCGEPATPLKPVVDAAAKSAGWGTHAFDAKQLIDILPVAKCTASIIVGEDGATPHEAYAYVGEGDAQVKKYYDGETPGEEGNKFSRDTSKPREFTDVTPNVDEENVLGSILLGAHAAVTTGFSRIDNATLKLTGKVDGFDYAAAAQKLAGKITEIETVQQSNEPAEAPVKVVYYDLNGVATSAPQGIAIKVATYANGYMKVSKVVVK